MRSAGTRMGRGAQLLWVVGVWLAVPATADAQSFNGIPRPPGDVPTAAPPAVVPAAPTAPSANAAAPKGPMLQSLPPTPAQLHSAPAAGAMPVVPPGQGALSV